MSRIYYVKTGLTGGTSNDLDGINGSSLNDGDVAFVYVSNIRYEYILDDDLGESEDSPRWIVPDSNPGTKVWVLQLPGDGPKDATIATGVVALTCAGCWAVDTEGAAAYDEVTQVTGLADGQQATFRPKDDTHTVAFLNGTNLKLQGNFSLDSQYDRLVLEGVGSNVCVEVSRSKYRG